MRRRLLEGEPLCRHCRRKGLVRLAEELDHIVPLHLGGAVWDPRNLQPLCKRCHSVKTRKENSGSVVVLDSAAAARGGDPCPHGYPAGLCGVCSSKID